MQNNHIKIFQRYKPQTGVSLFLYYEHLQLIDRIPVFVCLLFNAT